MNNRIFIISVSCAVLLSCNSQAADKKLTASSFEDFQQIQTLTRDYYCSKDKHSEIQKELTEISKKDQADRMTPNPEMTANDTKRRVRVAAIAAESCLKDKDDYFTAAVVFQHGSLPEHYMQATLYANKSAALGHPAAESLRLLTIDRYLMSLGYKQIFGSQVTAPAAFKQVESDKDTIPCLWPIEDTIDLVEDYEFGTREYRITLRENLAAKKKMMPECDFLARDSSDLLTVLLNTKI